jgi:ABC-type methionine transport system permease subunit
VNFIAVEAGTVTAAPVCGLRPVRALRAVVLNEPKPGHATFSPFIVEATTRSKKAVRVRSASAFVHSAAFDISSMSSAFVIVVFLLGIGVVLQSEPLQTQKASIRFVANAIIWFFRPFRLQPSHVILFGSTR